MRDQPPQPAPRGDEPHPPWEVLRSEILVESRFLRVRREHVRASTGHEIPEYFVLDVPDFVVVLALTVERQVILVRQYRHGLGRAVLELPAGIIDDDESPTETAARELSEETGYQADRLESVGVVHPSASRQSSSTHCFLAFDCRLVGQPHGDPTETISLHLVSLEEVVALARRGELPVAPSLAGLFLGLERLRELEGG